MQVAMFPGQGSQSIGMGRTVLDEFPKTKLIFEEAEDVLSLQLRKICFEGPEEDLQLTANQQPAILTVSYAIWSVLKSEADFKPEIFCGHSLGEYSALTASGRLPFCEAVLLVRKRGQAMQTAVPAGEGAMAAIMGIDEKALQEMCDESSTQTSGICEIVNYNSETQLIVSGTAATVDNLVLKLKAKKIRAIPLKVSAPFHSSMMKPARLAMEPELEQNAKSLEDPDATGKIVANLTGNFANPYTVEMLARQIDSPVLWSQTISNCLADGAESFIEVGPGKALFGLARRSPAKSKKLLHSEDLTATIKALQEMH